MASGSSMMNGDISHPRGSGPENLGSLEETLQQMNTLIKENRELKGEISTSVIITLHSLTPSLTTTQCPHVYPAEALKQTNLSMKERFEGLSAWKEKQKEERDFLEQRLEEAKTRLNAMDVENEALKKRVEEREKSGAEVRQDRNCGKSYHIEVYNQFKKT